MIGQSISAEYQLLDGTVVANDKADLTDGSLDAAINRDENDALYAGENSWTGTLAAGGTVSTSTCNDWTDATSDYQGTQGDTDATAAGWTELGGTVPCDFVRSLYCFADVDIAPPRSSRSLPFPLLVSSDWAYC